MNKKAFVLMETIVVIVVISIALLTIFRSYNKILAKVKSENKYDTSEYIYMTKYIKDYLKNGSCSISVYNMSTSTSNPENIYSKCSFPSENIFNIKKIHIITIGEENIDNNLKKFDGYMIDYIRKLDVNKSDKILIVEYRRRAKDDKGNDKSDSKTNELYETYIASLEWN